MVWYNSEIKACIGKTEHAIKEEHLCQLAEGTEIGKRTEDKDVCILPNCWFVMGAQPDALYERFGSTDNGRLRALTTFLDRRQCCKVVFIQKFMKRNACFNHVSARLDAIAVSQQLETPRIREHSYDPAAFAVVAAMHAAMSEVFSQKEAPSAVAAALIKFVGKGHGTLAVANCALRGAAWAVPFQGKATGFPFNDPVVRFEDALAAAAMIKLHIASQLYVEAEILRYKTLASGQSSRLPNVVSTDEQVWQQFSNTENALRRWLDQCGRSAQLQAAVTEYGFPQSLTKTTHSVMYRARELAFSTGHRLVHLYGPVEPLRAYARVAGWQGVLQHMVDMGLAQNDATGSCTFLSSNHDSEIQKVLLRLALQHETLEWLRGVFQRCTPMITIT